MGIKMGKLDLAIINTVLENNLSTKEMDLFLFLLNNNGSQNLYREIASKYKISFEDANLFYDKMSSKIRDVFLKKENIEILEKNPEFLQFKKMINDFVGNDDKTKYRKFNDFVMENLYDINNPYIIVAILYYIAFQKENVNTIIQIRQNLGKRELLKDTIKIEQEMSARRIEQQLNNTIYPNNVYRHYFTEEEVKAIKRKREIKTGYKEYKGVEIENGEFYSHKLKKMIEYESGNEKDFYVELEKASNIKYFVEQPFKIEYQYKDENHFYYPDVFIVLEDNSGVVVEIVSCFEMGMYHNICKWKGLKSFCREKGIGYLITDGKKCVQDYMKYNKNREYEEELLDALKKKPLNWYEYEKITEKYAVSGKDFVRIVLKNRLIWDFKPFRIEIGSSQGKGV